MSIKYFYSEEHGLLIRAQIENGVINDLLEMEVSMELEEAGGPETGEAEPEDEMPDEPPPKRGQQIHPKKREKARQMILDGKSVAQIYNSTGITKQTIYNMRNKLKKEGLITTSGAVSSETKDQRAAESFTKEQQEQIKDMRDDGMTTSEIAQELNLDPDQVAHVSPRPGNKGKAGRPRKQDKPDTEKVRELHDGGLSTYEIAMALNLSEVEVENIVEYL